MVLKDGPTTGVANLLRKWAKFQAKKPRRAKSNIKKDFAGRNKLFLGGDRRGRGAGGGAISQDQMKACCLLYICSKKAKNSIIFIVKIPLQVHNFFEHFEKIFAGPLKKSWRAKNGPRAPGWPPLSYKMVLQDGPTRWSYKMVLQLFRSSNNFCLI